MKALISKGRWGDTSGAHMVELTPIHNDWLSWKTQDGSLKIIHEKCYFRLVLPRARIPGTEGLSHMKSEKVVCAYCGRGAPSSVEQFILLANTIQKYEDVNERL